MRDTRAILSKGDTTIVKWASVMSVISGIVLIGLALLIFAEVFLRFLFNTPIPGVVELGAILLAYIVFFPQAYTLATGGHVQMTLVTMRMPSLGQLVSQVIASIFGLLLISALTYRSWFLFWNSFVIREQMRAVIDIPWYVGKFAMPVGLFLFTLQFLSMLSLSLYQLVTKKRVPTISRYGAGVGGV